MRLTPLNGMVLCECIAPAKEEIVEDGIAFTRERLPLYRVLSSATARFEPGAVVVSESTGTRLNTPDGIRYLFDADRLACEILNP